MAHRIIISNRSYSTTEPDDHQAIGEYEFTFYPSHHLTEAEQNKRIAKIRRVLEKLVADVVNSNESPD